MQVAAVALELLQHLAAHHTSSKELEELLLEGPAGAALLTAVGRSLHTTPLLFQAVAELCKVRNREWHSCFLRQQAAAIWGA